MKLFAGHIVFITIRFDCIKSLFSTAFINLIFPSHQKHKDVDSDILWPVIGPLQEAVYDNFHTLPTQRTNNNFRGFTSQNRNMIIRDNIVEGSGNFDHGEVFIVHRQCAVHRPLAAFRLHQSVATVAKVQSCDLWISSEVPQPQTTAAGYINNL